MRCWLALALASVVLHTEPTAAQQSGPGGEEPHARLMGAVRDARSALPLRGVLLQLSPVEAAGQAPPIRSALSDSLGAYRFEALDPGVYRLRGSRVGYRPLSVDVSLSGGSQHRISIELEHEPIVLAPQSVRAQRAGAASRPGSTPAVIHAADESTGHRTPRGPVAPDVDELSLGSLPESSALGERDLFRALQRLPSASTRSDYTAELWTRGAAWHETRVYFDGIPLFSPPPRIRGLCRHRRGRRRLGHLPARDPTGRAGRGHGGRDRDPVASRHRHRRSSRRSSPSVA